MQCSYTEAASSSEERYEPGMHSERHSSGNVAETLGLVKNPNELAPDSCLSLKLVAMVQSSLTAENDDVDSSEEDEEANYSLASSYDAEVA